MAEVRMSEVERTQGVERTREKPEERKEEMNWRRWVAGVGVFLLFAALFVSAGAKGALGDFPKYVAFAAVLLLVVSGIAGVINWMTSGGKSA
jgi:protein-S-isoprenylcysteine O-methyltransferase Ste14